MRNCQYVVKDGRKHYNRSSPHNVLTRPKDIMMAKGIANSRAISFNCCTSQVPLC